MSDETDYSLSYRDKMAVEEHEKLSPRLVYEIIAVRVWKNCSGPPNR
jgi:hypothetical protein